MDENIQQKNETSGISFAELWLIFKRFFLQIVVFTLLCTIVAAVAFKLTIKTQYTASAKIIVNPANLDLGSSSGAYEERNKVELAKEMLPTISELITNTSVVIEGIDDTKPNVDKNVKGSSIKVSYAEDSTIFTISYSTQTSAVSARATVEEIANTLVAVSLEKNSNDLYVYFFANALEVIQLPKAASSSNSWLTYTLIVAVLSLVLAYAFFLLVSIFDDTIKSKGEVEKLTGFNLIAFIEDINAPRSSRYAAKRKKSKDSSKVAKV